MIVQNVKPDPDMLQRAKNVFAKIKDPEKEYAVYRNARYLSITPTDTRTYAEKIKDHRLVGVYDVDATVEDIAEDIEAFEAMEA